MMLLNLYQEGFPRMRMELPIIATTVSIMLVEGKTAAYTNIC